VDLHRSDLTPGSSLCIQPYRTKTEQKDWVKQIEVQVGESE